METAAQERTGNPFSESPVVAKPIGGVMEAEQHRAVAEVQAAMVIARRFPRDPVRATDLILQDCTRPALAESAVYDYGRGGSSVTGPSIRLAETIARRWGNIECGVKELSRHNGYSECVAYAWDLETNARDSKTFQVRHWRDTKGGGYPIKEERDIYEIVANMGARRKRACILAVIPGDVVEAAVQQCEVTLKTKADITPERLKSLLEKFGEFKVTQDMIEKRIQRRVDAMTPALLVQLGKIYNSLRDGMSSAGDWFEVGAPEGEATATPQAGNAGVKEALRKNQVSGLAEDPRPLFQQTMDKISDALLAKDKEIAMLALDEVRTMANELEGDHKKAALKALGAATKEIQERKT